jgi:hypothetical protein
MRRILQLYAFWCSCLGAVGTGIWYISALLGSAPVLNSTLFLVFFVLLGVSACIAYHRNVDPEWQPMYVIKPGRIRFAKILLGFVAANFILCVCCFLIAAHQNNQNRIAKTLPLILTSLLLQCTVYLSLHWAFRPKNFLPVPFVEAISNPLVYLLHRISRKAEK